MESDTISSVPEGLKECLEILELPSLPPFPLEDLDWLEQRAPFFFATDSREVRRMDYPEDRDAILDRRNGDDEGDSIGAPASRYAGFGLVGTGLQDKHFVYLIDVSGLRLGLSLPWGLAYGEPEKERNDMEAALRIAHACQRNLADIGVLRVFLGKAQCVWEHEENGILCRGDDVASLLDHLTIHTALDPADVPPHLWLRV